MLSPDSLLRVTSIVGKRLSFRVLAEEGEKKRESAMVRIAKFVAFMEAAAAVVGKGKGDFGIGVICFVHGNCMHGLLLKRIEMDCFVRLSCQWLNSELDKFHVCFFRMMNPLTGLTVV